MLRFLPVVTLGVLSTVAHADLVATFDGFTEGDVFDSFSDGGIFFSNVFRHQDPYTNFAIEDASAAGLGTGFSPPNVLGFGGYLVGPGVAFGAFGGLTFTAGHARSASLELWSLPLNMGGNTITLTGYRNGFVVNTDSFAVPNSFSILHYRFQLPDDDYDTFKLTSDGPTVQGDSFIDIDNVTVAAVPEPTSMAALGLGALALLRRRRR